MPERVAVVGAGIVGLSTAWFLQEHGVHVTVHDRRHVAAGSSWGNAGWLNPSMTAPLPEPSVLRYGVRAVLSPSSPVYVPLRPDPHLLRFLTGFARHSTARRWATGMRAYAPINRAAVAAFDELTDADVDARTYPADPFLACFRTPQESAGLLEELEHIRASGQDVGYDVLTGSEARAAEPTLSDAIGCAVRLHDQHYINPPVFLAALADAVRRRGGRIVEAATVTEVRDSPGGVVVSTDGRAGEPFDQVVLAHGAWLGGLARRFGVRQPIQAGRGYSFSVAGDRLPHAPLYFPKQRVACTPLTTPEGTRLRVAGMMEFRAPDAARGPSSHRRDRRGRPPVAGGGGPRRPTRGVGRFATLHRRRTAADRADPLTPGLRRGRSCDVGDLPGPDHGQAARAGARDGQHPSRAGALRPAAVTAASTAGSTAGDAP